MATIHPSSIIDGPVEIADDVEVGPRCILTGPLTIGPGSRLIGEVLLQGPLILGADNTVYPFACLGFAPQDIKFDPRHPGAGLVIGDGNVFREHITVNRATSEERPTTIGNHNYFMAGSHAGHDVMVADHCVLANGAMLGGSSRVDDRAILGGGCAVHQFCRVGRGAIIGGTTAIRQDLLPFMMNTDLNHCSQINQIGLQRMGMPASERADVRFVFRTIYRGQHTLSSAVEILRQHADRPLIQEYIDFIEQSHRGIVPGGGSKKAKGTKRRREEAR